MADILLSDIQVGFHLLLKLMSDILSSRDEWTELASQVSNCYKSQDRVQGRDG